MKTKNIRTNAQAEMLEQATYHNSYSTFLPSSQSMGFKIHSIRSQEQAVSIRIAEDFLANLGFHRNDLESEQSIRSFLMPTGTVMLSFANQEDQHHLIKIALPASIALKMALEEVIKARRSVRQYTGDKVPLAYLATALRTAQGITFASNIDLYNGATATLRFRSTASAGGIYPIDLYIAALNVEKLEQAIYQYNPADDCLVKLYDGDTTEKFLATFCITEEQISLKRAGFICMLVGTAAKSMHKYGNLGLGFTLQEIGSISHNIHLALTALGLGSVDCASYFKNEAHHILNLDGIYKHLFHTIVAGVSQ